jgi:hypothetical protein
MPTVRFAWCPQLVAVRRESCPHARWDAARRVWTMTDREAEAFLAASHARLHFMRASAEIAIDDEGWVVGFVQGGPRRLVPASSGGMD